jgi:hypothetical protein
MEVVFGRKRGWRGPCDGDESAIEGVRDESAEAGRSEFGVDAAIGEQIEAVGAACEEREGAGQAEVTTAVVADLPAMREPVRGGGGGGSGGAASGRSGSGASSDES